MDEGLLNYALRQPLLSSSSLKAKISQPTFLIYKNSISILDKLSLTKINLILDLTLV